MNKMAIFVEGRTELEFDTKLIQEIAIPKGIRLQLQRYHRGTTAPLSQQPLRSIDTGDKGTAPSHSFLLVDCGGETQAKSYMLRQYDFLVRQGYSHIVCHRDLGPNFGLGDLPKLELQLPYGVKTHPIRVGFIISVMEIEAWFLAEHSHFDKIDASLTCERIRSELGFDPMIDDLQTRPSPAVDLDNCYRLAGKRYEKSTSQITIDAIDSTSICLETAGRFPHLAKLSDLIAEFLSS